MPSQLPDYLTPNLRVVFCGTAVGKVSAPAGHYYSGREPDLDRSFVKACKYEIGDARVRSVLSYHDPGITRVRPLLASRGRERFDHG